MIIRRCIVAIVGSGFCVVAGWAAYVVVVGIQRPGNSVQLLLSLLGVSVAVGTWTLIDLVEKLRED